LSWSSSTPIFSGVCFSRQVTSFKTQILELGALSEVSIVTPTYSTAASDGGGQSPAAPPTSLVVKFAHTQDANRAGALEQNAYAKEVAFYEKYASKPDFPVKVPKLFACCKVITSNENVIAGHTLDILRQAVFCFCFMSPQPKDKWKPQEVFCLAMENLSETHTPCDSTEGAFLCSCFVAESALAEHVAHVSCSQFF
jgi:hypothetical protein